LPTFDDRLSPVLRIGAGEFSWPDPQQGTVVVDGQTIRTAAREKPELDHRKSARAMMCDAGV
jgi:hypothetical protein